MMMTLEVRNRRILTRRRLSNMAEISNMGGRVQQTMLLLIKEEF
jgi:hypothetical protein